MLESLKEEVCQLHMELPKNNLVAWTSGNVSALDRATGYVVIKPSGLRYEALRPEHMVVVDLDGKTISARLNFFLLRRQRQFHRRLQQARHQRRQHVR